MPEISQSAFRIFKNSAALTVTNLTERAAGFILPWYLTRTQSQSLWGDYNTALAFVLIVVPFAFWGLDQIAPREVARKPEDAGKVLANSVFIAGLVGIVVTMLSIVIIRLLNYPAEIQTLIILAIITNVLPRAEGRIYEAVITGLERMEWIAVIRLPATIVRTLLSILLLALGYSIDWVFILLGLQYGISVVLYHILLQRNRQIDRPRIDWQTLPTLFVAAIPIFLIVFSGEAFKQLDRVFLSKMWDSEAVGVYSTGILPIDILRMVWLALLMSLFPGLSRSQQQAEGRFTQLTGTIFKYIFLTSFVLVTITASLAHWGIVVVFTDRYVESVPVLRLLALSLLFTPAGQFLYLVLIVSRQESLALQTAILKSVTAILLNFLLIPRYGVNGAAISVVFTEGVGLVANMRHIQRQLLALELRQAFFLPALLVCAGSALLYLALIPWQPVIGGLIVLALFAALALWLGLVDRQEIQRLVQLRN